jgi:acyl dehydratase
MLHLGQEFRHLFSFSIEEVKKFMEVIGDHPMICNDYTTAEDEHLNRPVVPSYLSSSIFSKVFHSLFPGHGSVYLNQTMSYIRPMFSDTLYEAVFKVKEIFSERGVGVIETLIVEKNSGLTAVKGEAMVGNEKRFLAGEQTAAS